MEIEPFGDLSGRHVAAAFAQHIGRRGGCERRVLHRRSGAEDEREAQDFEIVGRNGVEGGSVRERMALGAGYIDLAGSDQGRLFHCLAR